MTVEYNLFNSYFQQISVRRADKIIAVSNYTKQKVIECFRVKDGKVDSIYNGMNQPSLTITKVKMEHMKSKLNINDKFIILYVAGRINDPRKNIGFLLNSFKIIQAKKNTSRLIIVGGGDSLTIMKYFPELRDNVIYMGHVDADTLWTLYNVCNVYVSPSCLEGFGLTLVEAMSCGKPVVALKGRSASEIISTKSCGLVVAPIAEDFAEAVLNIKQESSEINIQERINKAKSFSWEALTEKLVNIYQSLT